MTDVEPTAQSSVDCFPIRTVAAMTGVSAVTLRAWERRYGLVAPARTDSGHRLYSNDDVRLIRKAVALLERGVPIGRIAGLLADGQADVQVAALAYNDTHDGRDEVAQRAATAGLQSWASFEERMRAAINCFDEARVNDVYNEAQSMYPFDIVNQRLILPILRSLGEQWRERAAGIAEEHFFSTYLRNKLGARFHHLSANATGPALLTLCAPGERHELGLLMFALAAAQHGYKVVMLGAAMPSACVQPVIETIGARAVVMSTSKEPSAATLLELGELTSSAHVPVLVGGVVGPTGVAALDRIGVVYLGRAFRPALERIDALLDARPFFAQ